MSIMLEQTKKVVVLLVTIWPTLLMHWIMTLGGQIFSLVLMFLDGDVWVAEGSNVTNLSHKLGNHLNNTFFVMFSSCSPGN